MAALAATQSSKQKDKREENRRNFPLTAQFIDDLTRVFGPVKVHYVKEGDKEIGKPTEDVGTNVDKILLHHELCEKRKAKRR